MSSRLRTYGIAAAAIAIWSMAALRIAAQGANFAGQSNSPSRSAIEAMIKEAAAKPTPRAADGHPDLNGSWSPPELPISAHRDDRGNFYIDAPAEKGGTAPKLDATIAEQLAHTVDPNPPPYKPALMAKVKELASDKIHNDPEFHCKPAGVPRAGAPRQIVQTPKLTLLLYDIQDGPPGSYRLVPTDGRSHREDVDPSYFGDSIGRWEGDTLVIDVTHFNDETWLAGIPGSQGGSGYFHSEALHVVERLTRKGNTLRWEATVEDPNVLAKPWVMTPRTEILTDKMLYEEPICEDREAGHIVDKY
ncbi:MAG TPA: hypothetical protein VGR73_00675 [Bryobacteraceae bacterium]|nr:hypothetical protein [Bryobacteraceae bacterium]